MSTSTEHIRIDFSVLDRAVAYLDKLEISQKTKDEIRILLNTPVNLSSLKSLEEIDRYIVMQNDHGDRGDPCLSKSMDLNEGLSSLD